MDSFRDEIRRVPFLKISIPFVVGIVISQEFRLLWSVVFISVIALLWLIFLFKREVLKNCTTFLLLVALGFCAAQAAAPTRQLPRGEKVEALIEVSDGVKFTSRRTRKSTSAYVRAYRTKGDSSCRKSNERVVIYVDTAYLKPFGDNAMLYERRGKTGRLYIAVKEGLLLKGIILPMILERTFMDDLLEIARLTRFAKDYIAEE